MNRISLLSALLIMTSAVQCQGPKDGAEPYLLVGTYTSGKSKGIYVYRFNSANGSVEHISTVEGIKNPSFLAVAPDKKHVYSVSEGDGMGTITAFTFDKGILSPLNSESSGGNGPCYVTTDRTGKWVAAGNYGSGSLAILPVQANGSLGASVTTIAHEGKSVNENRQEKAHVHATVFSPDNRYLLVPDLGMDKIMIYAFDEANGKLTATEPALSDPGSGPRHIDFHPSGKYVYLMEELTGTVTVFNYDKGGKLTAAQRISSHPAGYKGTIGSADIHVSLDGKFLYASNRGESNTIAIFSIDHKNGQLKPLGHQPTMGLMPRNFNFDPSGNYLLVANQGSDNIAVFKIDKKTGMLTALPQLIQVPNPVCVKWVTN
ncbi:MAG: lactonase family protein [Chitinophagaceae bacterium]